MQASIFSRPHHDFARLIHQQHHPWQQHHHRPVNSIQRLRILYRQRRDNLYDSVNY
ncbi:hypothetical protein FOIG_10480 [Fusarium odoratissimum NRRL 54006]|uniref:Uncharacterized protein n=1 Tax=Fusarium odoratissimum (strain NRRL 54006) TaxID=1089451 RepID=X0J8A4_FUSO5|nr:uncharacterized protein FOIG_10480 [Fusarium odoratissimum NRRL 54006]EXL97443.1 hypothetical protein FOIG_10480 [Fusarium odoratissimum NRRL 54006]